MKSLYAATLAILMVALLAAGNTGLTGRSNAGGDDELSRLKKELGELQDAFAKFKVANTHNEGLISNLSRTSPPVGTVIAFAGPWPPTDSKGKQWTEFELGWLLCDGRGLRESVYDELAAVLGKRKLPDLRGCFLRGIDRGIDGSTSGRDKGSARSVCEEQDFATALPQTTAFQTGSGKLVQRDENDGKHTHEAMAEAWGFEGLQRFDKLVMDGRGKATTFHDGQLDGGGSYPEPNLAACATMTPGSHSHTINRGGDNETRPVNVATYWIIKFK